MNRPSMHGLTLLINFYQNWEAHSNIKNTFCPFTLSSKKMSMSKGKYSSQPYIPFNSPSHTFLTKQQISLKLHTNKSVHCEQLPAPKRLHFTPQKQLQDINFSHTPTIFLQHTFSFLRLHFHRPSIPKLLFQACSTRITIEVNECHQKAFKLLGDMSKTFKHITHPKSTSVFQN